MKQKIEIVNFRATTEFKEELKDLADKQHISLSSMIVIALNKYIKDLQKENNK